MRRDPPEHEITSACAARGLAVTPLVTVLVSMLGAACAPAPSPDRTARVDTGAVRAQLDSTMAAVSRAMIAGDSATLATLYTDSAFFAETGLATTRGRSAILAGAAQVFACCRYLESTARPERTDVAGDRAFQFGTYRDVIEPRGQPALTMHGRYAATFERDSVSRWRVSSVVVIRDSSVTGQPASP